MNPHDASELEPPPTFSRRHRRRWVLIILVGALLLAFGCLRWTHRSRVEHDLDAIRKAGFPSTLDEVNSWYAIVPVEENAALKFLTAADAKLDPSARLQSRLPVVGKVGTLPEPGCGLPMEM